MQGIYLLDVIHVFNIPNLDRNVVDFITIPDSNKRIFGMDNFEILSFIMNNYITLNDVVNEHSETDKEFLENLTEFNIIDAISSIKNINRKNNNHGGPFMNEQDYNNCS